MDNYPGTEKRERHARARAHAHTHTHTQRTAVYLLSTVGLKNYMLQGYNMKRVIT
jgi:hypothetical protein